MRALVALILMLAGTPAFAASIWDHNGSTVVLEAKGAERKFLYQTPRPGLPVTPGTLLFSGRREGDRYSGTAYVFSQACGPMAYRVSGTVASDDRGVTMRGRMPRRDASCKVIGYKDDILVFTLQDTRTVRNETREFISIGERTAILHRDPEFQLFGKRVYLDQIHPEDPGHDGEMIVGLSGIVPNPFVVRRSVGLQNGFAVMENGERWIVYDPMWYGGTGGGWRELLLAHEIGHHVCGHSIGMMLEDPWAKELEADRYAGSALRRAGHSLESAITAARANYKQPASDTHPGPPARIAAVIEGYRLGSPCESRDIVKPRVFTEAEIEEFKRATVEFCLEMAREFCQASDIETKAHRHSLIQSNCKIPKGGTYYLDGKRFHAFPGVDCIGGGRIGEVKDGVVTRVPY